MGGNNLKNCSSLRFCVRHVSFDFWSLRRSLRVSALHGEPRRWVNWAEGGNRFFV